MTKRTKALRFTNETINKIIERDESCLFCKNGYHMNTDNNAFSDIIFDIMHIIPKSSGGLGIEENGVLGCRYHHHLLDNGNKGLRDEMLEMLEEYLKSIYDKWDKKDLIYDKYK